MFDTRTTINHYAPDKIIEQRAPTDDSVRLLREMEEAARKQVMAVCNNEDNSFHCTQVVLHRDGMTEGHVVYSMFTLNGTEYEIKTSLPYGTTLDKKYLMETMLTSISEAIAEKLVYNILVKKVG